MLTEAETRDQLNRDYLEAYHAYCRASGDEKESQLARLRQIVLETARQSGFSDAIPEQTLAYRLHASRAPRRSMKVYKVFTLSDDGHPTALFVSGTEKLPLGVWLDAQDTFHFRAKNGKDYVPSTQNPFTDGGKTGASIEIPDDAVRQELIARGFLPNGSSAKRVTALAYRPGWHAGTLPFFPQGGKRAPKDSPYPNIHRYNQVVFECEVMADEDYTAAARAQEKAQTKDGRLNPARADLQYLPKDGFYYYATNPLTQNNPNLGAWVITGSIKINRALTQEECDAILAEHGMEPQAWEQGTLDLSTLGYTGDESEAARKTLAPITYDDAGHVIPLSDRFNAEIQDVRYQERGDRGETGLTEHLALRKKNERLLRDSLGDDGMQVYAEAKHILSNGNEGVQNAASVSAAILATRAKAWSEEQKKAGRKVDATGYMENLALNTDARKIREENLKEDVANWKKLIERYRVADKKEWKDKHDGDIYPIMDVPAVIQLLKIPYQTLLVYGSFFEHSVNPKHRGMMLDFLEQLPADLTDPIMITLGNKPHSYVFVLDLKDKNGATIVAPVEVHKEVHHLHASLNFINSSFGKTVSPVDDRPSFRWFLRRAQKNEVLYVNKKRARLWLQSYRNLSPTAAAMSGALYDLIITRNPSNVKTESDLKIFQQEYPSRYQLAQIRQGKFSINRQGKRKIDLLETADETTFFHEIGHVLYDDLRLLSSRSGDEQMDRDFVTVQNWAEWNPEQLKEYSDTPWSKEFMKRDAAIRFAIEHGDTEEESRLRAEWREERFARGFERYLQKGEAPTKALGGVFARCKRLFTNAYHAFRSLGGSPTPDVEKVMTRMLTPKKAETSDAAYQKEAYKKACKPYLAEVQRREEAVKNYQGALLTPESLPQDRFMQVMHDSMGKTNKEGKPLSYAYLATKALYEAKVPKDQIIACINNLAPVAAKDPARLEVFGTTYADYLTKHVESSRWFRENRLQAAKGR